LVKQNATPDSSFWIHATVSNVIEHLLEDFELYVTQAVADELSQDYRSGALLHGLIGEGRVHLRDPGSVTLDRFGPGERAAINLAIENPDWVLLMDDLRPFRAAEELGLSPVSSPVYAASLYRRGLLDVQAVLNVLARLSARSTVSPQLIDLALSQVAQISKEGRT
jgi:predicted nucleic acid-binding protein